MLAGTDFVVIFLYVLLMVWIGLIARRRSGNVDEYFTAGHNLPWWMAAVSHHVSGYSAVVFVGFAGRAVIAGFSIWTLFSLGVFTAMVVGFRIWPPRWSRLKVLTPVEYLETRYNNTVRLVLAAIGILKKFIDLGIKLFAISVVVHVVTGWDVLSVIIVAGLITVVYVLVGGLWATVLTDLIQFVIQLGMSLVVLYMVLAAVGGWDRMWEQLPVERSALFNDAAGIGMWFWLVYLVVIVFSYNGGTWGLAQRFISVGDSQDTQKAALLSGVLFLLYPIVIFIPAWAAPLILPESFDPVTMMPLAGFDLEHTYIRVTQKMLGGLTPGLLGLLICSMFAATMSMIDSDLNSMAAVFTKDIYQRNSKKTIAEEVLFKVGMISTVVFGLVVIVAAVLISRSGGAEKVFTITVKFLGGISAPIAIPFMLGLLWKRPTARGAILSLVGGLLTYAIAIQFTDRFEIYTGCEMLVSLALFFGDGLLSRHSAEKEAEIEAMFGKIED